MLALSESENVNSETNQADAQNAAGPCQALGTCTQRAYSGDDLGVLLGQLFDNLQRLTLGLLQLGDALFLLLESAARLVRLQSWGAEMR